MPPNNSDSHGTVVSSVSPHTQQTEMKADAPAGNTSML